MKKVLLWYIPTLFTFFYLIFERLIGIYIPDIFVLLFFTFTLFVSPCYFVLMIYSEQYNKIKFVKSFLYSILFILINAGFIFPGSIQVYLGLREWKAHDIDMFPLFVLFPIVIVIIGFGLIVLIRKLRGVK